MANVHPGLKAGADWETLSNMADGVAVILEGRPHPCSGAISGEVARLFHGRSARLATLLPTPSPRHLGDLQEAIWQDVG